MQIAQSSAVYFNYSLQYAIKDLGVLGYDGIEIWGGRPHMYQDDLDDQIPNIITLLNTHKMKVCNFIPAQFRYPSILCSDDEKIRQNSVRYIRSAMDNAVKVGSPSVSLCPGMVLFDKNVKHGWKCLHRSFEEIREYNQHTGLKLLIEPAHRFETNLIKTAKDCLKMIDALGSDDFGILLDTGHAHINGENFQEIIPMCKDYPLHIHVDDNHTDTDAHLVPGDGNINFPLIIKLLKSIGYTGFLSVELGTGYIMNPSEACRRSIHFLKNLIDEERME